MSFPTKAHLIHHVAEKLTASPPGQQAIATAAGVAAAIHPRVAAAPAVAGMDVVIGIGWAVHWLAEKMK